MAEIYGEKPGEAEGVRCPGESCQRWRSIAASSWDEKVKQIRSCGTCRGNPPVKPGEETDPELDARLVAQIENLIGEFNAGRRFDPAEMDGWEWRGVVAWREAEAFYNRLTNARISAFIQAMAKNR